MDAGKRNASFQEVRQLSPGSSALRPYNVAMPSNWPAAGSGADGDFPARPVVHPGAASGRAGGRADGERQPTEEELQQRIEDLDDFLENAAEGVHSVSADGIILWVNRAELELLGYERVEYVGRHIADFHADRSVVDDMLSRLARNETLRGFEARMISKDGTIKHVLVNSNVLWRDGVFIHTRCFTRDITARKRSQEALGQLFETTSALSQARTPEQVMDVIVRQGIKSAGAIAGSVYLIDPDGATLRSVGASGYEPQTLDRFTTIRLDAPVPLAEVVRRGVPIFLSSEKAYDDYDGLRTIPDESRAPSITALPLVIEGRPIGALGFSFGESRPFDDDHQTFLMALAHQCAQALDRARLFQAERSARAAAEASERRSAFLAEASAVLASSLDYQATLAPVADLVVPRVADWCLVQLADHEGASNAPFVIAHTVPAHAEAAREHHRRYPPNLQQQTGIARVIRTGTPELHSDLSKQQLPSSGFAPDDIETLRELGLTSLMIVPMTARGRVLGAIMLGCGASTRRFADADLTVAQELGRRAATAIDNARLYREAHRALRAREDLLAIVSHDLRSPLGVVAMNAMSLLREPGQLDTGKLRRAGERIVRSAATMERLISDLLDFASIDSGHLAVQRQPQPVRALMTEVIDSLRPLVEPRDFRLIDELPSSHTLAYCDRGRVVQILSNLVGNAVKATPETGSIAVKARVIDGQLHVSVKDSGTGIRPDALEHIFDRYWKARSNRQGLGLGLFITNGLVTAHGGRIWAESVFGQGSTFCFTLPLVSSEADPARRTPDRDVLIIDDDQALTLELKELLTENGYAVNVFSNGREALEQLETRKAPTLILLDLMMPEMDGWECLTALKTNPALRHVPIVLMSSVIDGDPSMLGASAYLRKPFRAEQAIEIAARYCDSYARAIPDANR
jgi:PAS domain S-box-containing protein